MQKIRKILGAVSEKTALPTNQPTNQLTNQLLPKHRFFRTWLTPVQKDNIIWDKDSADIKKNLIASLSTINDF